MPRRSSLALIFGVVFIDLIGFGIVIPILPLYAERFGASPLVIGLLLAIYSAMQCVCAPLLGRLSDRVGRRPVLFVSVLGTAVGFFLMGTANTLALLFLARIIDGATGGNISTALAYIADVTPPEERSRGMGIIGAAFGLGFIVGPALGGIFSHVAPQAPFFVAGALALANAAALAAWLPESLPPERRGTAHHDAPLWTLVQGLARRRLAFTLGTYFLTTVAFSLLTATYPLFTNRRFGYGPSENGYLFASQGLLAAIVQGGLLGWLVRRSSDKTMALVGVAGLAASLWWLPLTASVGGLLAATAVVAVGHGLVASTLNGIASRTVSPIAQGRVLGLMQSAASLARIAGPVLGGWLLHYDASLAVPFGQTPYWAAAGLMLATFGLALAL
ncbi:MAG: MFS transporter [Candidatus Omnitrophica bacterium]|nr:MFS transporter [Candidatus Omnitrophota bacterium]